MKPTPLSYNDRQTVCMLKKSGTAADLSHLKRVIIEVHNYCNRRCSFCPNSIIDRRSSISFMSKRLYTNLIYALRDHNFNGTLMFGRYHEPLSNEIIIDRVKQASSFLLGLRISINTNGDYFSQNILDDLLRNGLSKIRVMIYLPSGKKYQEQAAKENIYAFARKHELGIERRSSIYGVYQEYDVVFPERYKEVMTIHCENYWQPGFGCDRGGSLPSLTKQERLVSCYAPYFELNIDYNGSIMPCCNLLSDIYSHRKYLLGNLEKLDVLDAYNSDFAIEFRKAISTKVMPVACKHCEYYWPNRTVF